MTTTRTTQRLHHEQHLTDIVAQLNHAAILAANPSSELVITLDAALLTLVRAHHGRRNVRRTSQPTDREQHRRSVDQLVLAAHALVDVTTRITANAPPSDDRADALVHLDWITRTVDKIGYR
jgi:hypothetical protein